jgi:hypothetical protein
MALIDTNLNSRLIDFQTNFSNMRPPVDEVLCASSEEICGRINQPKKPQSHE